MAGVSRSSGHGFWLVGAGLSLELRWWRQQSTGKCAQRFPGGTDEAPFMKTRCRRSRAVSNRRAGLCQATSKTETPSALPTAAAQPPAGDPGLAPLDQATIRQLHATIRTLPAPVLEGFSKAFRKRFQVPAEAPSIADRICQRRHHDWIETFMVSHR